MSEPFIGEIQLFGFNFNPRGWAYCNGAMLPISQNTALFSLIGTTYGGNGLTTFQLPNLAGRAAMGYGQGPGSLRAVGETAGRTTVTLTASQIPSHRHVVRALGAPGARSSPSGASPAAAAAEGQVAYGVSADVAMRPTNAGGGGLPHENRQPYLGVNFCIALQGIFPAFP